MSTCDLKSLFFMPFWFVSLNMGKSTLSYICKTIPKYAKKAYLAYLGIVGYTCTNYNNSHDGYPVKDHKKSSLPVKKLGL